MAFDQTTRNRLQRFVNDARRVLEEEFTRQLQNDYGMELLRAGGRIGAITSRTCFFLSSFQKWREEVVLRIGRPEVMSDLGFGVMDDAAVEAAAYVLEKQA